MTYLNKIFAVYKPKGITSNKILSKFKKMYKGEKVGHAGTLDPLAEGVLVIGIGRLATKKLGNILKNTKKTYLAEIELGKISTTDDLEGEIKEINNIKPSLIQVKRTIKKFKGNIYQTPPLFSAVKVNGQKAYQKARKGEIFKLKRRKVKIYKINLLDYNYPILKLKIVCSSGTYIRSLARDIGRALNTGGYLKSLVRLAVGKYKINNALKI